MILTHKDLQVRNRIVLNIILGLFVMLIVNIVPYASAEMQFGSNIIVNNLTQIVTYHAIYSFEDTSATGVGKNKDIPVSIYYQTQDLPYDLTTYGFAGSVDYCNLTLIHNKEIYDNDGNLINSTNEVQSYLFNSGISTGIITINLRSRDYLTADMSCHYTDASSVFADELLFGSISTYFPSFECAGCTPYTLEELSHQTEVNDEISTNSVQIWSAIQKIIDWNYQLWLIASWFIKIALVLVAVSLIFAGFYYFYMFLVKLSEKI